MRAMILAAGKGERMQPFTNITPKPMLKAGGKPLLQYHIESLVNAGIREIVINTGRLGDVIESWFGSGHGFGADIQYSREGDEPLETGGGIKHALPLLGSEPFIALNGDIWTDFNYSRLLERDNKLIHLVLVKNPPHHPDGDFVLQGDVVSLEGSPKLTFSGIGLYPPAYFSEQSETVFPLLPLLQRAIREGKVTGELFKGHWLDVGTPERLQELEGILAK